MTSRSTWYPGYIHLGMGPGTYIYTIGRAEKHSQHCTVRGLFVSFLYWEVFDSTTGPEVCEICEIGYLRRGPMCTRLYTRDRQTVLSWRSSVNRDLNGNY